MSSTPLIDSLLEIGEQAEKRTSEREKRVVQLATSLGWHGLYRKLNTFMDKDDMEGVNLVLDAIAALKKTDDFLTNLHPAVQAALINELHTKVEEKECPDEDTL